jgi:hypothetical protein
MGRVGVTKSFLRKHHCIGQFDLPLNLLHDIPMLQTNNSIDKKISTLYWFGSTQNQVF